MIDSAEKIDSFRDVLRRALQRLNPQNANCRGGFFLLEIGAALLSVLALRDGILGAPAVSVETLCALGLWATLFATACRLATRRR